MKFRFNHCNSLVFEYQGKQVVECEPTAHLANHVFGVEAYAKMRTMDTIDRFQKEHDIDVSQFVKRIRVAWIAYLNTMQKEYDRHLREYHERLDVSNKAAALFVMHPAPWDFKDTGLSGYVVDANGKTIFGGERHEGYVSKEDPEIVAIVNLVNSVAKNMKGEINYGNH